ncbi:unnamed protein product [Meloidogyne enterolobii]|uniref:Uncharacterized protein n=2 Tax=Meloidogyne enterolobii TaxID=390850 RepID=A0ACB0YKZ6_MELEN|nr:unnamed protein product [Meloidogyne enterolobii]
MLQHFANHGNEFVVNMYGSQEHRHKMFAVLELGGLNLYDYYVT